jgi:hypothetical protein
MEDLVKQKSEMSHMSRCTSDAAVYKPTLKIIFHLRSSGCFVTRYAGGNTSAKFLICTFAGQYSEECGTVFGGLRLYSGPVQPSGPYSEEPETVFGGLRDRIRRSPGLYETEFRKIRGPETEFQKSRGPKTEFRKIRGPET